MPPHSPQSRWPCQRSECTEDEYKGTTTVYPIPVVTGGKVPYTEEEVIKLTAGKLTFKQL